MKKSLLLLLISVLLINSLQATEVLTQNIRGNVTDAVSGYPIIGAYVILLNITPVTGTVTDINGEFDLKDVPIGRQSLQVTFIGYESKTVNNLMLVSGKELVIEIQLEEKVNSLLSWCYQGSAGASVTSVDYVEKPVDPSINTFSIKY